MSHPQAHFRSGERVAASPELDPAALTPLAASLPVVDALKVMEADGLGRIAARTIDGFTHVVAGLGDRQGAELWDAPFWRSGDGEVRPLPALEPGGADVALAATRPLECTPRCWTPRSLRGDYDDARAHVGPRRQAEWDAWVERHPRARFGRRLFSRHAR